MNRIKTFLFTIIALMGISGVMTSCQEDAPVINYTMNVTVTNDFKKVVEAIENGFLKNEDAVKKLTESIDKMNADQAVKLQSILDVLGNVNTTLETKLAAIEAAMKAQTISLEGKLDLLKAAIDALPDYSSKIDALAAAIDALPDYSSKLEALKAAIEALPDYSSKLDALKAAIEALPDYSSKFDAVVNALGTIQAEIEALGGSQAAIADKITDVTEAINDLIASVNSGNTDTAEALAAIVAMLEELKEAISSGGGGETPLEPYIRLTTGKAIGDIIELLFLKTDKPVVEGATIVDSGDYPIDMTRIRYTLNQQTITIKGKVTWLSCQSQKITAIDVSNAPDLELLRCDNNELQTINVSKNTKLKYLGVSNNMLNSIDLSQNTELESLWIEKNRLTRLDVSNCTQMFTIICCSNQLTEFIPSTVSNAILYFKRTYKGDMQKLSTAKVSDIKSKGWRVMHAINENEWVNYDGEDNNSVVLDGETLTIVSAAIDQSDLEEDNNYDIYLFLSEDKTKYIEVMANGTLHDGKTLDLTKKEDEHVGWYWAVEMRTPQILFQTFAQPGEAYPVFLSGTLMVKRIGTGTEFEIMLKDGKVKGTGTYGDGLEHTVSLNYRGTLAYGEF